MCVTIQLFGNKLSDHNCSQEGIKSRLKSGMLAIIRCRIFVFQFCCPKI